MALTIAEIEFMSKMPSILKGIEELLKRIAETLEKLSEYYIAKGKKICD